MTIADSEKIDFLWKKIIYGVSKTANALVKAGPNETVASPLPGYSNNIWTQVDSGSIPSTPPGSNTGVITVFSGSNRLALENNPTTAGSVSWLTNMSNFVPPTFGAGYQISVYGGDPVHGAPLLSPTVSGQEWVFDYNAGTLNFDNTVPASVLANGVYIYAYQYNGATLDSELDGLSNSIASATQTFVVANIADRDALSPSTGDMVHVLDASGDPANAGPGEFADYIYTGSVWQCIATQASAATDAKSVSFTANAASFSDSSDVLAQVGNGTRVVEISVVVSDAFDGSADITIGTAADHSLLMDDSSVDLGTSGTYVVTPVYQFPVDSWANVSIYYSNTPTVGNATIVMTFA